ncbi:23S rRNA (adenine(2503)-C(2))-methyltransferase RlmN [Blastopirellula retiformator]|uniref:Probable dual-specificity RNA methyltransferase RlmN n=1 Tax=Blastopirellula retiformator TaxID=2527970 RepID=A0A5C5VIR2_9BACT|nr:23S rRNA (adenine(2503)-C(2))-methyltransferase RlmN [Blastopirellula retiformator]TWT38468.1 putative dual-specificity RNA methyltransferase RlmN [Blastopirellula retiformator]
MTPHLLQTLDLTSLQALVAEWGLPKFRAQQIRSWIVDNRAESFDDMANLPKALRGQLAEKAQLWTTKVARHTTAADGTEKLLLQLHDGGRIECVLLRDGDRRTICISSQVGCAMGCVFCASGLDGVERNLTVGEIIEQMLRLQRLLPVGERLSHIVVMGMGEPLANVDRLLPALDFASAEDGLGISHRRITISTVGLPPAIRRLADRDSRYHLAVSLHAPDDELRNKIVPTNKKVGIQAILDAADHYFDVSGRRLTFEYVLLAELNDQPEHAYRLARLLKGRPALLNIIPYNPVAGLPYRTPSKEAQHEFRAILENAGLTVKFRQKKGDKINAACGQLRRNTPENLVQITG